MNQSKIHDFLVQNVSALNGVGLKTRKLLKKKKLKKYLICYGIYLKVLQIDQIYKHLINLK
tara:strand:+ start:292 stop:474 length:183 start_codon:yes stop_codon:yes gene_type:complete